jgi:Rrf2 family protein
MTSRFTLAAHILGMLAWSDRARAKPVTSEEMARSINTNPVVVRRVLSDLRRAGLVDTKRGVGGGVTLARRADSITLRDAWEAVEEGEEIFGRHPSGPNPCCQIGPLVAEFMEEVYGRAERAMKDSLEEVTIASMSHEIEGRFLTRLKPPQLAPPRVVPPRLTPAPASGRRSSTRAVTPGRPRTAVG